MSLNIYKMGVFSTKTVLSVSPKNLNMSKCTVQFKSVFLYGFFTVVVYRQRDRILKVPEVICELLQHAIYIKFTANSRT